MKLQNYGVNHNGLS